MNIWPILKRASLITVYLDILQVIMGVILVSAFYGIDKISRHWRGTHMVRSVSQNEMKWVHKLRTMQPSGLNIELDLNCFLTDD